MAGNRRKSKLLKPPVIWPCVKIQQDSRQAANHCAMSENTTRLQATEGNFNYWSHQLSGHVWEYSKIPGKPPIVVQCVKIQQDSRQQGKFKWLKPPVIWPCVRIQQDSRQATNSCAMCENTTRLQATGENWSYWSHHVWKYNKIPGNNKIAGNGGNI